MQNIQNTISLAIKSLYGIDFSPDISPAPKPELGEYCIGTFQLAKPVGKSPNGIAEELARFLSEEVSIFKSTSATGGYVNFFLTDTIWMEIFQGIKSEKKREKNETVIVDYIGMNVGKPPHIGHICTPLQGQSIINVLKYIGYSVISDSHLGDWGLLFGKLIIGFKKYGSNEELKKDAINHLLEVYVAINTDTEADPSIEQICRDAFRDLSGGKKEYVELWTHFTSASIATNKKMLELMHIHQDYDIGESFYEGLPLPKIGNQPDLFYDMNSIVDELIEKGIAIKNMDGSVGVTFPEETKIPSTILRKKDGTNLYLTSDLAAIKYRITNGWNPSKILYFVDVRQSLHLKQAFWVAKHAWNMEKVELFHAANGAIVLPEGAMSTRKGTIIRLDSLVGEGFERVKSVLGEKGRNLKEEDIREIAIGAIKYSYLSQDRERDVTFTWDKALNFEGNSGPYIQYAYVRAMKICEQSTLSNSVSKNLVLSSNDKILIQTLARMESAIENTAKTYKPHHLAIYSYDLAVSFNSFYVNTPKILEEKDGDLRNFRLDLVQKTAQQLQMVFELLAIKMPSEM